MPSSSCAHFSYMNQSRRKGFSTLYTRHGRRWQWEEAGKKRNQAWQRSFSLAARRQKKSVLPSFPKLWLSLFLSFWTFDKAFVPPFFSRIVTTPEKRSKKTILKGKTFAFSGFLLLPIIRRLQKLNYFRNGVAILMETGGNERLSNAFSSPSPPFLAIRVESLSLHIDFFSFLSLGEHKNLSFLSFFAAVSKNYTQICQKQKIGRAESKEKRGKGNEERKESPHSFLPFPFFSSFLLLFNGTKKNKRKHLSLLLFSPPSSLVNDELLW